MGGVAWRFEKSRHNVAVSNQTIKSGEVTKKLAELLQT